MELNFRNIWEYGRRGNYAAASVEALGVAHHAFLEGGRQNSELFASIAQAYATLHLADAQNHARLPRNPDTLRTMTFAEANLSGAAYMDLPDEETP